MLLRVFFSFASSSTRSFVLLFLLLLLLFLLLFLLFLLLLRFRFLVTSAERFHWKILISLHAARGSYHVSRVYQRDFKSSSFITYYY